MRTFTAKKIKVVDANGQELLNDANGNPIKLSYVKFAEMSLNAPFDGISTLEMRARFKVLDKIENLNPDESVELEDAEFETLKKCVNDVDSKSAWPFLDRELIAFVDYINEPV